MPKAAAAAKRLRQINSSAEIEPLCADVQPDSITGLLEGIDLVLDGTDNIEARYVINRACARAGVPWIYGGVIQAAGMSMTVLPGDTPCFRCVFPEQPPPGSSVTCATAGVIVPAVHVTAAVEVSEALKLLTGQRQLVRRGLFCFDMWRGIWETEALLDEPDPNCPDCSARNG